MCTVVISRQPDSPWPVIIAANRDEMSNRLWRPPARHWDDHPHVIAGIDEEAGGTWMGLNDDGLLAAVLNRPGSLGPVKGKRSRGELPLEALSHAEATEAARAIAHLDGRAYRSFNMLIADARDAFWVRSTGDAAKVDMMPVSTGISMLTANDLNDQQSARISAYLPQFRDASRPDPDRGDWRAWQALLGSRQALPRDGERGAMNVGTDGGFMTVCSSLVALPGLERFGEKPKWLFAAGSPDRVPYLEVPVE
ncbi:MAG: NRDE family protein [Rhodospirillales bacterium]